MLSTALSGKYKIGDTIVVNVDDGSVLVNEQPVYLRRQVFSALLLLMEKRLHEAAVSYDDFSKTQAEDQQTGFDVISNDSIRVIVSELNKKLQQKLIVRVPGIGYKLDAEVFPQEPRDPVIPPTTISEYSQLVEKLDSVIDNIPELIRTSIAMVFSDRIVDNAIDLPANVVSHGTDIDDFWPDDVNWPNDPTLPLTPLAPVSLQSKSEDPYRVGDVVLRHWKIVRCISQGSYSTVYEAHRTVHGVTQKSAIKVIHSAIRSVPIGNGYRLKDFSATTTTEINNPASQTFNASDMIQNELAHMIALKGTSYIVSYEDHDIVDLPNGSQDTIIRMELLEPISKVLHSTTLTGDDVVQLGIDICKALELCVDINIVHRDVKPSNIFLTQWGGYKLGDFSASTTIGEQHKTGQIGTLMYMAPEIYRGEVFSANIDTYSLGLVMYELLNGKKIPFLCEDGAYSDSSLEQDALSRRLSGEPLPKIPGVSGPLQSVILKACAFDPAERFQSPLEMCRALEKLR